MGDVSIHVPTAMAEMRAPAFAAPPTPEEIIQRQAAELQLVNGELERQRIAANTIANVALATAAKLIELGHGIDGDTVEVPSELRRRYEGGHLTIEDTGRGDYLLRIRERGAPAGIELAREDTT